MRKNGKTFLKNRFAVKLAALAVSFVMLALLAISLGMLSGEKLAEESYASDNTYSTKKFYTNITANQNNSFDFLESIQVDFTYPHHGIYRYIPMNGVKVSNVNVPGYEYESSYENGNYVLQIGSADYTLSGVNDYKISYRLTAWDDENTSKDVLMLNLIPSGWQTDIDEAKAVVELPKEADMSSLKVFSGQYGTEGNEDNATVDTLADGKTIVVTAENLPVYHGITITMDLPEGYWTGERQRGAVTPGMILLLLLGPILCFIIWFMVGRDIPMVKTIEFYPPDDLTPGEMGYMIDERADKCDLVSSIVYMANKGYLAINEKSKGSFQLTKKKAILDKEPEYIKTFYEGLFVAGDTVCTDKLGASFGLSYSRAEDELKSMFANSKGGIKNSKAFWMRTVSRLCCVLPAIAFGNWESASGFDNAATAYILTTLLVFIVSGKACRIFDNLYSWTKAKLIRKCLVAAFLLFIAFALPFSASESALALVSPVKKLVIEVLVAGLTLLCIFLAVITEKTNDEYVRILGRVLGFRDFIATAEVDKLKELVEEDPEYFYNISPYAYVFGLSNKWIKNFENIPTEAPKWFGGSYRNITMWDAYWMGHMMSDCSTSMSKHIDVYVPSGSGGSGFSSGSSGSSWSGGGFSGGGFSGGGMGGGGGGAW